MTKAKSKLLVINPYFKIAVNVPKATQADEFVVLPKAEYLALVKAATNADR